MQRVTGTSYIFWYQERPLAAQSASSTPCTGPSDEWMAGFIDGICQSDDWVMCGMPPSKRTYCNMYRSVVSWKRVRTQGCTAFDSSALFSLRCPVHDYCRWLAEDFIPKPNTWLKSEDNGAFTWGIFTIRICLVVSVLTMEYWQMMVAFGTSGAGNWSASQVSGVCSGLLRLNCYFGRIMSHWNRSVRQL